MFTTLNKTQKRILNFITPTLQAGARLGDMILEVLTQKTLLMGAKIGTPTISVGVEGASATNARDVTININDLLGAALAGKRQVFVWLSDSAAAAASSVAPDGGISPQSSGILIKADTANIVGRYLSNSSGVLVLRITESTAKTYYINVIVGESAVVSAAVAFA